MPTLTVMDKTTLLSIFELRLKALWDHFDDYYVFNYRDDEVKVLFHIGVEKADGMRVVGRSFLIDEPYYGPKDGECCPSFITTTTYQWNIKKRPKRN